jgi:Tol biopolymer transport system component
MDPERWRQISHIYGAAQDWSPAARAAFLDEMCGGDASLQCEIESLLALEGAAAEFLERPPSAIGRAAAQDRGGGARFPIGTRFGEFEVAGWVASGGMGEVYLARDLTLERTVALKFLAPELTRDPGLLARFRQEARAASSLNHPNVCTIHALGETPHGQQFIAMEHIPGETLRARLGGEPRPLQQALDVALQIASALTAAHDAGIVHRDLKPENVMLRPDGLVKVVDFGIAKLTRAGGSSHDTTRSALSTDTAIVAGTAAYMSPEQARGLEVDARTDVWSLGVMLYEMVAGSSPFAAETSVNTFAAILDGDPPSLAKANAAVPSELERIVRKALRKDRNQRYQVMQDLLLDLRALRDEVESGARASHAHRRRRRWFIGGTAALALIASGLWSVWPPRAPSIPISLLPITSFPGDEDYPDLSPDGSQIAFNWSGAKRDNHDVYVMRVGDGTAQRLTTDPATDGLPAWSPDGSQIAFVRVRPGGSTIYTISPMGGRERKLADRLGFMGKMSWLPDGQGLVFESGPDEATSEIVFLNTGSGKTHTVLSVPISAGQYRFPTISPRGDMLAFAFCKNTGSSRCQPSVVAIGPDVRALAEPQPLAVTCRNHPTGIAWTPDNRTLVYGCSTRHTSDGRLWRIGVAGRKGELIDEVPAGALNPTTSRVTGRLAYTRHTEDSDLWILHPGGPPEAFAASTDFDRGGAFSPDGNRIAFASGRTGQPSIWVVNSDGTNPTRLTTPTGDQQGSPRWSPDGRRIAFDLRESDGRPAIYVIDADGGPQRKVSSSLRSGSIPSWSHDGKWVYYTSAHAGRLEVLKSEVDGGQTLRVTQNGGQFPRESPDGQFLFYVRDNALFRSTLTGSDETSILPSLYNWSYVPVNNGIYYVDYADTRREYAFEIRFLDFATGATTVLNRFEARGGTGLSVSNDRKTLLFSGESLARGNDLMLFENFK